MSESAHSEIEQKIKRILISELRVGPDKLAASNSTTPLLGRGIGLDSMETLVLVAGIEKEFDIQVDDADLTADLFKNLGALVEYVVRKVSDRVAAQ
ncbi:MAG: acyl carrier protein [Candidatus Binatia bacterium]|jgi:acyl carrier protein